MKQGIFKVTVLAAAIALLGGCAATADNSRSAYVNKSMISAADFDAMINVEVRELEPLPVEQAVASID